MLQCFVFLSSVELVAGSWNAGMEAMESIAMDGIGASEANKEQRIHYFDAIAIFSLPGPDFDLFAVSVGGRLLAQCIACA